VACISTCICFYPISLSTLRPPSRARLLSLSLSLSLSLFLPPSLSPSSPPHLAPPPSLAPSLFHPLASVSRSLSLALPLSVSSLCLSPSPPPFPPPSPSLPSFSKHSAEGQEYAKLKKFSLPLSLSPPPLPPPCLPPASHSLQAPPPLLPCPLQLSAPFAIHIDSSHSFFSSSLFFWADRFRVWV
jgi:hypothetical protein